VRFDTAVGDLVERTGAGGSAAELLDADGGGSFGAFDLVVDAMGLHSKLRHHRVDDAVGIHYEGMVLIHGMVLDPEASFPPALWEQFAPLGTMLIASDGYRMVIQHFGAGPGDRRVSINYTVAREDGDAGLFAELGIERPTSREGGIMTGARLAAVVAWLGRDMAGVFDPLYIAAMGCLDRVTVRGSAMHGETALKDGLTLPLVCVGDSSWNCGLGGGGILAMQDAVELSKVVAAPGAFDGGGAFRLPPLRAAEAVMLGRKAAFNARKRATKKSASGVRGQMQRRKHPDNPAQRAADRTTAAGIGGSLLPVPVGQLPPRALAVLAGKGWTAGAPPEEVAVLLERWLREDFEQGRAGFDAAYPIFANVREYLDAEVAGPRLGRAGTANL
jgi:hypothetical protein